MTKSLEAVAQLPARDADKQTELSRLRAEREQLEAARTARELAAELDSKIAAERLALAAEQAIAAAEAEHGQLDKKIRVVRSELGIVIMKRAHPAAFKRFMDRGKHATKDLEELARLCLVHPTLSEFEAMCDEQPMLTHRAADAVAYLAGVRQEDIAAKS